MGSQRVAGVGLGTGHPEWLRAAAVRLLLRELYCSAELSSPQGRCRLLACCAARAGLARALKLLHQRRLGCCLSRLLAQALHYHRERLHK